MHNVNIIPKYAKVYPRITRSVRHTFIKWYRTCTTMLTQWMISFVVDLKILKLHANNPLVYLLNNFQREINHRYQHRYVCRIRLNSEKAVTYKSCKKCIRQVLLLSNDILIEHILTIYLRIRKIMVLNHFNDNEKTWRLAIQGHVIYIHANMELVVIGSTREYDFLGPEK